MNKIGNIKVSLFEDCINQYGALFGDNSLRYIGITISKESIVSKIYRTPNDRNVNLLPEGIKNIWRIYFKDLEKNLPLSVCDYSFSVFDNLDSMRLEVLLDTNREVEYINYILEHSKWLSGKEKSIFSSNYYNFKNEFNPDSSVLRIIGIECDTLGNLLNLKYYLYFNKRATISTFSKKQRCLINQIALSGSDSTNIKLQDDLIKLQNCNYQPIFIGVNQNKIKHEAKLYYISKHRGRKLLDNYYSQIIDTVTALQIKDCFTEDFYTYLKTANIFLEGVACSINEESTYRLYFKQIPQRFIV